MGDPNQLIQLIGLPLALFVLFYFLMIRPQQQRMKKHQEMLNGLKRGDNIVLSSGVFGKIVRVEDLTVGVEIATGVTVKVRKGMITEVESRGTPAPAKTPPAAKLLLKAAGVGKGSAEPQKTKVAKVTWDQVRQIAETKKTDLNANDIDAAAKIIAGTARSMGITVE